MTLVRTNKQLNKGVEVTNVKVNHLEWFQLKGFCSLLKTPEPTPDKKAQIFRDINDNKNHFIFIATLEKEIVGTVTIAVEPTFECGGKPVAFIKCLVCDLTKPPEVQKDALNLLVGKVVGLAQGRHCHTAVAAVVDDSAISFLKEFGFEMVGSALSLSFVSKEKVP